MGLSAQMAARDNALLLVGALAAALAVALPALAHLHPHAEKLLFALHLLLLATCLLP